MARKTKKERNQPDFPQMILSVFESGNWERDAWQLGPLGGRDDVTVVMATPGLFLGNGTG